MNKKKLLAPLFVAASFMLVACSTSEIVARPSWINDPIVIVNGEKITDNNLKAIYDAIKKLGDTNSNVLNKVMYEIAQKQLGTFEDIKDLATSGTDDEIKAFVEKHPCYVSEKIGWDKANDKSIELTEAQKIEVSRKKIQDQYTRIKESIFESLYNDIKGGDYCLTPDKKLFQEEYFVDHLWDEMYWPEKDVTNYAKDRVMLPKPSGQSWEDYVNYKEGTTTTGFLHVIKADGEFNRIYYPVKVDDDDTEPHHDGGYIGRKILPEIYRTLLIENYVREQRYTNLGRSYARKVKMIAIPHDNTPVASKIYNMLNYFTDEYIGDPTKDTPDLINAQYNLDYLNDAMIGFAWNLTGAPGNMNKAYELLTHTQAGATKNFDPIEITNTSGNKVPLIWKVRTNIDGTEIPVDAPDASFYNSYVYKGTKLGDLVEKYLLTQDVSCTVAAPDSWDDFDFVTKDHFTSEAQTAYDDITNNKAYDLETGLRIKERELRLTDMTTDGWFLKNGGLTDVTEEFRNKLYNIKTSNILDDEAYIAGTATLKTEDPIRYYGNPDDTIMGRIAFVRDAGNTPAQQIILDGDTNYYIIEVDEAASASKLSTTDLNRSYLKLKATDTVGESNGKMDEIVKEVVKQVANSDTYKKNAEQYYLMISNILFYDQSVYDYFKSQFPELFK